MIIHYYYYILLYTNINRNVFLEYKINIYNIVIKCRCYLHKYELFKFDNDIIKTVLYWDAYCMIKSNP